MESGTGTTAPLQDDVVSPPAVQVIGEFMGKGITYYNVW